MTIPEGHADKTSAQTLKELSKFRISGVHDISEVQTGLYSFSDGPFDHDFIFYPGPAKRLFVLLSGAIDRKRLVPPVFQRWSWARFFPGHCLYIADPTIKLYDQLSLGWYLGNKDVSILPTVANLIAQVAKQKEIEPRNIFIYASSGGGFAALQLSLQLPEATILAINPQTDLTKYHVSYTDKVLAAAFGGLSQEEALKLYPDRLSILPRCRELLNRRIIYIQNKLDSHHLSKHFHPFAKKVGLTKENGFTQGKIFTFFFENPAGHGKAEQPELLPVLLEKALELSSR